MADTTVLALFERIDPSANALRRLQTEARFDWRDLMVISSAPFPEGVLVMDQSPTRLPVTTVICSVIGVVSGILLAGGTALLYAIPQGGKPIVPGPPTAIIAYEMMMAFALTGVFLRALYEIRLPDWRAKVYDDRISEGLIGIAAHCATEQQVKLAESIMREEGAGDVVRDARRFE
ncbi:hypothetical protein CCAX7_61330 [Capsulimonas corticalis]|uniref:Uncharacterized protein n=1 Tax=Capsulimonas corticalis TaxID=2219043 RepID=A0A402CW83_9BACT|nr:quinol:electron acceptor oxidoreductase subunit ActD [Capsulimonas corticalis]BDI34082.1 hypothetical protein CCAX7_61330 [Capsulimonas corticalis]